MPQVSVLFEIGPRAVPDPERIAEIQKTAGLRAYKVNIAFRHAGDGNLVPVCMVKFYYKDEEVAKRLVKALAPFGEVRDLGKQ